MKEIVGWLLVVLCMCIRLGFDTFMNIYCEYWAE
jgi:hypothetical protein